MESQTCRLKTGETLTNSQRADENTNDVCVFRLLDDNVPSHQEFVGATIFEPGLSGDRIVGQDLNGTVSVCAGF